MGAYRILYRIIYRLGRGFLFFCQRQGIVFGSRFLTVAQAPEVNWQKPASLVIRPHASSLRKEAPCRAAGKKLPKENPSKGFSLDSFGNKRAAALLRSREAQIYSAHPVERLLRILEALSFWHASTYWHVKSLTILLPSSKFGRLVRRKAFLLCKNPCGAGCNGGRGTSSQRTQPPRKEIFRGNLLCAELGLANLSYSRLPSTQKYVSTLDS